MEIYFAAGVFFLIVTFIVAYRNIRYKVHESFFWYCDIVPLLLAISFFTGSTQFIKGMISVGLISQFFSMMGLTSAIFFKKDFVGFAHVTKEDKFYASVELLIHLFSLILALFLTYKVQPENISLLYSFVILSLLLTITLLFTKKNDNVNFIHNIDFLGISIPYQEYLWLPLAFFMVVIPTYIIQYSLYLIAGH